MVIPPLERPMAWLSYSNFGDLSVAVHLDDRGIDHGVFHVRLIRDGFEKPLVKTSPLYPVPVADIKTEFHLPNLAGKSRQGLPVRAIHRTASTK